MSVLIETKQTSVEGIEQFWYTPIRHCLIEFIPGKSYNYALYAIYGSYDDRVLINEYNSKREAKMKIIELMTNNPSIIKKEE